MTLVRLDENISFKIAKAWRVLDLTKELQFETPKERRELGYQDVDWISAFASRGGKCLISGDAKMRNIVFERAALQASGLIAIFPPAGHFFRDLRAAGQAGYLTRWLLVIQDIATTADVGEHFRLPADFSADRGRVLKLPQLV